MSLDTSPLFRPLRIKGKTLRNRIVMPPMAVCRGLNTPEAVEWYGRRARGGAALVVVEATSIARFGFDLTAANLRPLVSAIHDGGALAAIQLFPTVRARQATPEDLSLTEIDVLVQRYRMAAGICAAAGFDAIEPHGAHGYLLNQFFSPDTNRRTDAYGGTTDRRMRLATEIIEAIRPSCGASMFVMYRHTPVGRGYGIEESVALASRLINAGVEMLDLSPSSRNAPGDLAVPFSALGVPVVAVNELDVPERAVEAITLGRAHLVAVGRGLIADPDWPIKVQEGRFSEIIACTRCDGCHDDLRWNRPVTCRQWPAESA
ncbi:MAG TPA: NADH:flavin oxidoreductase [Chloroflexi bacterium]|nr:NADH:flavin oxidoreductase [Chloroflexota bacterium]